MEDRKTREVIMQVALEQFAENGYAAVSMRDIASAVGIRASSIYYHFSGKRELFDALIQKAKDLKERLNMDFMRVLEGIGSVKQEAFVRSGVLFLTEYLHNSHIEPLLKVLELERFHNEEAQKAWRELLIVSPMKHEAEVFRLMQERGELVEDDVEELAAEYQSAVLLAYFTGNIELFEKQLERFYLRTIK